MRVLCVKGINKGDDNYEEKRQPAGKYDEIYEGETYTVVNELKKDEIVFYYLAERRHDATYWSGCFIPLSNIDETELVNERELIKN